MSYINDKRYSLKQIVIFLSIAFCLVTAISYAAVTIPNTFTSGTTISASQMNANFDAVKTAVDSKQDKPASGAFLTSGSGQVAWALLSCPAASPCWIPTSYNSTGGAVSPTTYGAGIGGVTFTGVDVTNASVQITSSNLGGARVCYTTAVTGSSVNVRCDDLTGTAVAPSAVYITVMN